MARLSDYLSLTRPRLTSLNLLAGATGFVMASGFHGDPGRLALLLLAGYLAAGGCGVLNGYLERDLDRSMARTAPRVLPTGRVEAGEALVLGVVLVGFGLGVAYLLNPLTLLFVGLGVAFYIGVYTLWLKRRTPWNIVIGGAAGAFPPLAGWAAATGEVGLPALLLGLLIFQWTPGHFWGLAIRYREDYARAGIPMLPVVAGQARAARWAVLSNLLVPPISIALVPIYGLPFGLAAGGLGALFVIENLRLLRDSDQGWRIFRASNIYLSGLFGALLAVRLL